MYVVVLIVFIFMRLAGAVFRLSSLWRIARTFRLRSLVREFVWTVVPSGSDFNYSIIMAGYRAEQSNKETNERKRVLTFHFVAFVQRAHGENSAFQINSFYFDTLRLYIAIRKVFCMEATI